MVGLFEELANNAPVMIWRSRLDKLCDFFNKPWLDFTGRTHAQEFGMGWAEGVHPDDFDRCVKIYTTAFDAREKFSMEYRLRRHDGVYRWILDTGTPFIRRMLCAPSNLTALLFFAPTWIAKARFPAPI